MNAQVHCKTSQHTWTESRSNVIHSRDFPSSAVEETRSKGKCHRSWGCCEITSAPEAVGVAESARIRQIPADRWSINRESIPRHRQAIESWGIASNASSVLWLMASSQLSSSLPVGTSNICVSTPHLLPKKQCNFSKLSMQRWNISQKFCKHKI